MRTSRILFVLYTFFLFVTSGCGIEQQLENTTRNEDLLQLSTTENSFVRVIILFSDAIDRSVVEELNGEVLEEIDTLPMLKAKVPEKAIPILRENEKIISVERDRIVETKPEEINWGIGDINVEQAWNDQYTGQGIKIAILDSGIEQQHEDLNIAGGVSFVNYTDSFQDDNGHGTHVAGIIGALDNDIGTVGVAPQSELYAVKVLDQNGEGYLFDIISGIDWSIQKQMDIINMSIGTENSSPALLAAVNKAYNEGILMVAAAGNNGNVQGVGELINYPANYPQVVAVGASNQNRMRASFSATGNDLEFLAPGTDIISTFLDNQYVSMDGTSMATPMVAGIFALMKEKNPPLSLNMIREQLQQAAIDIGIEGKDTLSGFGLIQFPTVEKESVVDEQEQNEALQNPSKEEQQIEEEQPQTKEELPPLEEQQPPTEELKPTVPPEEKKRTKIEVNDIQNSWAQNEILNVIEKGWMIGTSEDTFSPNVSLSRAQATVILVRALQLPIQTYSGSFDDVPTNFWAKDEIETAKRYGLIEGVAHREFNPKQPLTREEMAALLFRAFKMEQSEQNDSPTIFKDLSPRRWSFQYISLLSNLGVIKGFNDQTFRPQDTMTREQMAALMIRAEPYIMK